MSTTDETSGVRASGETTEVRTTGETSEVQMTAETIEVLATTAETIEVRTTVETSEVQTTAETIEVPTTAETIEVRTTVEISEVETAAETIEVRTTVETSEVRRFNCAERCNNLASQLAPRNRCRLCAGIIALKIVIVIFFLPYLTEEYCHIAPGIDLKAFALHDMVVFHNVTATNSTPWQVSSNINLTLSFKNRNGVVACFTTPFRTEVSVYYAGNSTILESDIPLYFTLKPERSRGVSAQLLEDRFVIVNDSAGSALAADLRRDNITLQLELATRYSQSDGTIKWIRSFCEVVARTPLETNSRPESLLGKKCVNMK